MTEIQRQIQFHKGQHGKHSYFNFGGIGSAKGNARVPLITVSTIRKSLQRSAQCGVQPDEAVLTQLLTIMLPRPFQSHLAQVGISLIDAWNFMLGQAFPSPDDNVTPSNPVDQRHHPKAHKLASILASLSGGGKTPEALLMKLVELLEHHREALALVKEWETTFGLSKHGGRIIIGNRSNQARKKSSSKAS